MGKVEKNRSDHLILISGQHRAAIIASMDY